MSWSLIFQSIRYWIQNFDSLHKNERKLNSIFAIVCRHCYSDKNLQIFTNWMLRSHIISEFEYWDFGWMWSFFESPSIWPIVLSIQWLYCKLSPKPWNSWKVAQIRLYSLSPPKSNTKLLFNAMKWKADKQCLCVMCALFTCSYYSYNDFKDQKTANNFINSVSNPVWSLKKS